MAKDKIRQAQELIDEGKYDQARRLLKGVDDPRADRLRDEINDLQPPKTGGIRAGDIVQVLLMAVIFTGLFGGIGYVVASSMGIPPREDGAPLVDTNDDNNNPDPAVTPGGQIVAVEPSATPTPTEIPCEAQAWWDSNREALGAAVETLLSANVQTSGAQINTAKSNFTAWKTAFEAETAAPCVQDARNAITSSIPRIEAVFDSYLNPTTDQERAQTLVRAMDSLLASADAITAVPNLTTTDDAWLTRVQDFTRGECPAKRWYIEIIQGKDYRRFFQQFNALDFNQVGAATSSLREMQGIRGAFAVDSATFPECVKTASDYLLAAMDGLIAYGNARLGGDVANIDPQLQAGNLALTNFYSELTRLEPTLSGVRLQ